MPDLPELLFTGTGRTVTAIDRLTGRPVWRVKVGGVFSSSISMILLQGTELYVGRAGYVYCMEAHSGRVLWERGVGSGAFTLMAVEGQPGSSFAAMHAAATATAAAASSG